MTSYSSIRRGAFIVVVRCRINNYTYGYGGGQTLDHRLKRTRVVLYNI